MEEQAQGLVKLVAQFRIDAADGQQADYQQAAPAETKAGSVRSLPLAKDQSASSAPAQGVSRPPARRTGTDEEEVWQEF
jgi:hypothetical protein